VVIPPFGDHKLSPGQFPLPRKFFNPEGEKEIPRREEKANFGPKKRGLPKQGPKVAITAQKKGKKKRKRNL